ncbi:hypothetical protein B9Z19DRAFT_1065823 [Tuber borchii]|uniref:Uncharacterized protein n=1 Tax=Tuber borchii TaxID=42251 RepID=A0A2T6ZPS4_TUBBO|nr:hypothetical protein B9Z19DRAFT_1065823 [Tuber borchii]
MPFFAKLKLKLKAAWAKISLPFVKKSTKKLGPPGYGQVPYIIRKCPICNIAIVPYRITVCYNLVGIGYYNLYTIRFGPEEEEEEEDWGGMRKAWERLRGWLLGRSNEA